MVLLLIPFITFSQDFYKGIKFEQDLTWQQVKEKAKKEGKYIFVDCFTTWCGPCKKMERDVYSLQKVGDYFNEKFINVKVQMDSTNNDKEPVKQWYSTVKLIENAYKVDAYPTFLFLSADGTLMHKASGAHSQDDFIIIASDALNPKKQYHSLLTKYKAGEKDTSVMKQLALTARKFGDKQVAKQIAVDYINSLHDKQLYWENNLRFIMNFVDSSSDKGFKMAFKNPKRVNDGMKDENYSNELIVSIIIKEDVLPLLSTSKVNLSGPNWELMQEHITKKYGKYFAERSVIDGKKKWFKSTGNWPEFCKYLILSIDKYESDKWYVWLNNDAWDIFVHSTDSSQLLKALSWSKLALSKDPYWTLALDTYANLLYKLGKTKEAVSWEEKAVKLSSGDEYGIAINENYKKMKEGIPTWE